MKPLSETRWECRMESLKAIRYQAVEVCDALEDLDDSTDDVKAKSDAESLVNQMRDYKFLVSLVFWHTLLHQVNCVSKELQSNKMNIARRLTAFQKFFNWLKIYREKGFNEALVDVADLAKALDVERVFKSKRLRKRKRVFNYESVDEPLSDPETAFKVQCLN